MKIKNSALAVGFASLSINSCGLQDSASDAQQSLTALQAEYESFDLTCNFEDITGSRDAETAATADAEAPAALIDESSMETPTTTTASTCENVAEQYSVLVDEFDTDGDGVLSDSELAEAHAGWEQAQKAELDANGDGIVSEEEKAAFRQNKLGARKEKLNALFEEGCKARGKQADECRHRREHKREEMKQIIQQRLPEFDKDGDGKLNEEERKALLDALRQEREQRKEQFGKQADRDGDGQVSPDEREQRRDERNQNKPERLPPPGGGVEKPVGDKRKPEPRP